MTDFAQDESAIRDQLKRINDAWRHHRGDAMTSVLSECFASEVVMRGPGFSLAGKGREAAVQSYVDFTNQAEVKAFNAEDPTIDVAGDTAVAQYQWQMTYVLAGQEYTDQGHDLFVFSRIESSWLVVWRALLPGA
jgi:ketosteroid isomerase-like protein